MSENRESWEKALASVERGWIRMHGRSKDSARSLAREAATLRATIETLTAERDAATKILIHWITAQGFDPNGGPEDEADWDIINAALVLQGMLPLDHPSIQAALCTETEGSEG